MARDIRYCRICHHRLHTKMKGIACKRGLNAYNGRCERFLEDEIARQAVLEQRLEDRTSFGNIIFTIYAVEFIVLVALMCGAYFGGIKIGQFLPYFLAVIALGIAGAVGAWGIEKMLLLRDRKKMERPITMDGVSEYILEIGLIPTYLDDEVSFKIEGKEYVVRDEGDGRMMLRRDVNDIPQELTQMAQCAAYEASYESYMAKVVIFRRCASMLNYAEISIQIHSPTEKEFRQDFKKYIGYIDAACLRFTNKLYMQNNVEI